MRVLLIGGGDLAQQIAHYIRAYDTHAEVVGFVDDYASAGEVRFGLWCLGTVADVSDLYSLKKIDSIIISIGYNHLGVRQQIFEALHPIVPFYTFVHPTAFIDISAVVGEGCFLGPLTIIEQRVVIGSNTFLYGGVNVSHDSQVGAHTFIAPSVAIAGFARIGQCCFLGLHATVIERVRITDDVVIGAATLVLDHLLEPGLYVGAPARKK